MQHWSNFVRIPFTKSYGSRTSNAVHFEKLLNYQIFSTCRLEELEQDTRHKEVT